MSELVVEVSDNIDISRLSGYSCIAEERYGTSSLSREKAYLML